MRMFLERNGLVDGPYNLVEIKNMQSAGGLDANALVCPEGEENWIPLSQVLAGCGEVATEGGRRTKPPKQKSCLLGCLLPLLSGLVITVLVVAIAGYMIIFHSSIPLKIASASLTKLNPRIEVEGISGSISRGASFKGLRYHHADGNISYIEDVGISHNPLREIMGQKKIIIYELHAKRAHLYLPQSSESTDVNDESESESVEHTPDDGVVAEQDGICDIFEIRKIDIEDVVIEHRASGKKLDIERLSLEGYKAEKGEIVSGELTIKSNFLDFHMPSVVTHVTDRQIEQTTLSFSGAIKPAASRNIGVTIIFSGEMLVASNKLVLARMQAFDEALELNLQGKDDGFLLSVTASELLLSSYMPALPLADMTGHLTFECSDDDDQKMVVDKGHFEFGLAHFEVLPQEVLFDAESLRPVLLEARASKRASTYQMRLELIIPTDEKDQEPSLNLCLTSIPESGIDEILADLLFNEAYTSLSPAQHQKLADCRRVFVPESHSQP